MKPIWTAAFASVVLLSACAETPQQTVAPNTTGNSADQIAPLAPREFKVNPNPEQAVAAFKRVSSRVEPVAEGICKKTYPTAQISFCDYKVAVDTRKTNQPNAFQTVGDDGRPIIAFNIPMIATVENDDEIAFILGHEAGHHILQHLEKRQQSAQIGAVLGAGLAVAVGMDPTVASDMARVGGSIGGRAYSKQHELEADEIGTYIAYKAGYDPIKGAQSFARFPGSSGFLSTHPPSNDRYQTVVRTAQKLK